MKQHYYNIKYGIRNLIRYFHVVWNDRNHDYEYTLRMLKFKLELQQNYMLKYKDRNNNDKTADEIGVAIKMINDFDPWDDEWTEITFDYISKRIKGWWD